MSTQLMLAIGFGGWISGLLLLLGFIQGFNLAAKHEARYLRLRARWRDLYYRHRAIKERHLNPVSYRLLLRQRRLTAAQIWLSRHVIKAHLPRVRETIEALAVVL